MRETQSRIDSAMEAICNIAVGLAISMTANAIFIPLVTGSRLTAQANAGLAIIYTIISFARSYAIRRAFNGKSIWYAIRRKKNA